MKKNIALIFIKDRALPFKQFLKINVNATGLTAALILKTLVLLIVIFTFIAPPEVKCQQKFPESVNKIRLIEKDPQSGLYKVEPVQLPAKVKMKSTKQRFDQHRFEKALNKLKKISNQHDIYKRLYHSQQQAEKERTMQKSSESIELEKIKLFGKPTIFYKAPFIPKVVKNSFLSKPLVSNVLINGKNHDTISVHDPFTLTFSFAPNYISAVVNVYIDADNNGIVSTEDFPIVSNGLLMDNSEYDEDLAYGSYKLTFPKESFYTDIVSSLIFEVNDYQSVSSAVVAILQKPRASVILGTITPPLQNLLIEAKSSSFDEFYVFTDSLGKFEINVDRSQTNQVVLRLFDIIGMSNGYLLPEPKLINITSDTTEVNFILDPATAFIEGYVKDQNGTGIKNVNIEADNSFSGFVNTKTDSLGYYKLGVKEGAWYIYTSIESSADYMREYYSITVNVPNNSTVQQDFTFKKANSTISGKVTLNTNGIGGIPIRANSYPLSNAVLSTADGSYELPVYKPTSETRLYTVSVPVPYGYYVLSPTIDNVPPGATNVNFEIKKVTGGLQGKITDLRTGKPIPDASILVSGSNVYRSKYSNDSGYYRISLEAGLYSIDVTANNYFSYSTSNIIIGYGMATKNIALVKSGSFSGSIKDETGNPMYYTSVIAMDTSGYPIGYGGYPDENGNYTISQLTTSKYGAFVSTNGYLSQWYNQVYEKDSATFFQVTEGYDTPNIDFVLSKGGSISGRAVDKFGKGIAGVSVDIFDTLFNQKSFTMTDDSGYYSAAGLATGMYYVRMYSIEFIEQWYNGSANSEGATKVLVTIKQNTTDINFILTIGASISGMVKDKSNLGVPYAEITILDSSFSPTNFSYANDSGYYFIGQLQVNKKYYVKAQGYGYASQWYDKVSTPDSATQIILQTEEKKENIDFILAKSGAISGRVFDNVGNPLSYIYVNIEDSIGNYAGNGMTDFQGKYIISSLANGKYYASATDYNLYEVQWFDHKTSRSEADPINVVEELTTENINFDLQKIGEIPSDSIIIKIELANIPNTLTFSQSHVGDYYSDYWWSVLFDMDGLDTTGTNGCEIEIALLHYKLPGEPPFESNIVNGTYHQVIEWKNGSGSVLHSEFPAWIDQSNENLLVMSVPKSWSEINNINANTKYHAKTYYSASDGGYQDMTQIGYGGAHISDPQGDVAYNFIDILSTSWQLKPVVSVSNEEVRPEVYSLSQNFPNPFNPSTIIRYELAEAGKVRLKVYDVLGNEVAVLVNEYRDAGSYEVEFNASCLASGIYFYRIEVGGFVQTKKMSLLK